MRREIFPTIVVVAAALAGPPSGGAASRQESTPPPPVNVRVIATDARGRPVRGLAAGDLEVAVGATRQDVISLTHVAGAPRSVGILLDEYHVAPGAASERARAALQDFVQRTLRADDTVMVVKPLDPPRAAAPADTRAHLATRIAGFDGRKGDYTARSAFEAEYISALPPAADRQRAQVTRAAMQSAIVALSQRPAPRALIVVTEGFAPEDRDRERLVSLRTIAHAARSADVTVYLVDPSPARVADGLAAPWRTLVAETGGLLVEGGAPLEPALGRIAAELDDHYVARIPAPAREDGAYHEVTVTMKRPGIAVRTPRGFWAHIAAERYTRATRPAMSTYLKTPHVSGIVQPSFRMAPAGEGRTAITFAWRPREPRRQAASVVLSVVTFEGVRLHESRVAPQDADAGETRAVFSAPPGPVQVALTIADAAGKVIDTDVRYIEVPRLDGDRPVITAVELVRTRTVRDFQRLQTDPEVLPAETRDFDRRDRLIVRVRVSGAPSPIVLRLLNRAGSVMRELPPLPAAGDVPQFDLPLAPYARGDYRLHVTVGTGEAAVSQLVPFRLIG